MLCYTFSCPSCFLFVSCSVLLYLSAFEVNKVKIEKKGGLFNLSNISTYFKIINNSLFLLSCYASSISCRTYSGLVRGALPLSLDDEERCLSCLQHRTTTITHSTTPPHTHQEHTQRRTLQWGTPITDNLSY